MNIYEGEVSVSETHKKQVEYLVRDTYCPGLIQDTMDGAENFNNFAFKLALGYYPSDKPRAQVPPTEEPFSYLQAFSMRIDLEREGLTPLLHGETSNTQYVLSIYI